LTTAEQIRELTADQASRGYPVRLRAVITYIDPSNGDFFVQDSTAGIYISEPSPNLRFQPGDLLEIEGITESDFAPEITKARYRLLGQAPLPRPHQVHLDDLLSTREDSQWVQVEGIVQGVEPDRDRLKVDFVTEGRRLLVYVMGATGFDWNRLIDATVKVTGVCATLYNQNNQLVGVWVVVPTPQQVSVEEPPLADPFSAPLRPISRLMIFTGANASAHRVRVQGTVTLQRPRGVFIQDGAQGL
jgi:hypothetical protein